MPTKPAADANDPLYDRYVEHRKVLIDGKQEAAKNFDQAMLALAGGALGLTVTFLDKFVPIGRPMQEGGLLLGAWLLFVGSILCTLISFLSSFESYRRELENWTREYEQSETIPPNWLIGATLNLNRFSLGFFIVGVVLFVLFVWRNLQI